MKIDKYILFAFLYFFLNSLGLPFGLTYTTLLSPLLYYWILVTRKREILFPFFLAFLPFAIIHLVGGVDMKSYFVSVLNLASCYIFGQAFYTFLIYARDKEGIFRKLVLVNFILCLIAIPLYFTPFYDILWIEQYLTEGVDNFRRLKLFTYEASYYATLFTPLFIFYFLKIILKLNKANSWQLLLVIFLPLALSFSLGVISAILIAWFLTCILLLRSMARKRRVWNLVALAGSLSIFLLVMLVIFFPENSLFSRIGNVISGTDLSGNGRTSDAFLLADRILALKSHIWGVGAGQVKIVGADIIRNYYNYPDDYMVIAIPNTVAETWALFGWVGLVLRMGTEVFLFFHTRVWTSYYRLFLFLFVFIYQFTGSFITNIAEYVIWILAFTHAFPQFDVIPKTGKIKKSLS
ncbi:MAG TPA: hypothetical protein VK563_20510 [Puia sp.]|nr:hypothetical protein [Puia sp.]